MDESQKTAVYRLFDVTRVLLYIGITDNIDRRMGAHRNEKAWWAEVADRTVQWFPSRPEAEAEEVRAIRSENPRYNVKSHPEYLARCHRTAPRRIVGTRVNVNARMAPDDVSQIDAMATADDRTRSDMVRILLDEALAARARAGNLPPIKPAGGKR